MNTQQTGRRSAFLPAVAWMAGISLLIVSLFGCLHISGMGYLSNWFLSTPSLYIIEANVQNALDTIWGNQVLVPDGAQEGDCLCLQEGVWQIDREETLRRRQQNHSRAAGLFARKARQKSE